jgi:hypothetical protein
MIRSPSSREAAWEHYAARMRGEFRELTTEPQPGLYSVKRNGRRVPVQIDLVQDIDEAGELLSDERIVAWVDGEITDADSVWSYAAKHPITQEEFDRLKNRPAVLDLTREIVT